MTALARIGEVLGTPVVLVREGEAALMVGPDDLQEVARRLRGDVGGRLATLFASDDRAEDGCFHVHHVWSVPTLGMFVRATAPVDPAAAAFPSVSAANPAANWFEREIGDLFGLTPVGHPNPTRVALHDDWPEGEWALRKDFPIDRVVPRIPGEFHPFRPVTGEGVFHIPVGPVHAGIIEPGHFHFGVAGEPVLYLQLRLFYVHKGIEKRFEQLPWRHGTFLAESISGDTAVGHALAHAHAVERLAGIDVPARAQALRVVLLELERVYNHTADIGALATDVAFVVPASRAQAMRERWLRMQDHVFGSRTLRGTVVVGGVARVPDDQRLDVLRRQLRDHAREFERLIGTLIDAGTFTDRVDGTGVLTNQAAQDLGIVGMAARASGVDVDARRDHPHDAYARLSFKVAVEEGGDVRARLMVRAREVEQSLSLIRQALDSLPAGAARAAVPDHLPPRASALGWAEGWRGPCLHWIATNADGAIQRVKVTDPSSCNWPALVQAVPGNIVPDFPVINKSFNLSYSGNDR